MLALALLYSEREEEARKDKGADSPSLAELVVQSSLGEELEYAKGSGFPDVQQTAEAGPCALQVASSCFTLRVWRS